MSRSGRIEKAMDSLDEAEFAERDGRLADAARGARRALEHLQGASGPDVPALRIDALALLVSLAIEQRELGDAERLLAQVRSIEASAPEADFLEAKLRIERWEFERAGELLERCAAAGFAPAEVVFERALLAELTGDFEAAERGYAAAERVDPRLARPCRIDLDEAHELLAGVVDAFPADVRSALDGLQIDLLEVPDPAVDRSTDLGPTVLGYYDGVPLNERASVQPSGLDRIRIFKRNVERSASSRAELVEQLRITLLHEVGHHLGWDEHELHERGIG